MELNRDGEYSLQMLNGVHRFHHQPVDLIGHTIPNATRVALYEIELVQSAKLDISDAASVGMRLKGRRLVSQQGKPLVKSKLE